MKRIGAKVQMTDNAIENYGEEYRGVSLVVTHAANKYMPASRFYASGCPQGYHPGYDEGVSPQGLYDLKRKDNGQELNFSLYDYELKEA